MSRILRGWSEWESSLKLYRMSSSGGGLKLATRGQSKTRTSLENVSYDAFEAALLRPAKFMEKAEESGVEVKDAWKLGWKDKRPNEEEELSQIQAKLIQWLQQGQPNQPLFLSNSTIRSYRNELRTTETSKLYYSGVYAKRLTLPNLITTVPLPPPQKVVINNNSQSESDADSDIDSGPE